KDPSVPYGDLLSHHLPDAEPPVGGPEVVYPVEIGSEGKGTKDRREDHAQGEAPAAPLPACLLLGFSRGLGGLGFSRIPHRGGPLVDEDVTAPGASHLLVGRPDGALFHTVLSLARGALNNHHTTLGRGAEAPSLLDQPL